MSKPQPVIETPRSIDARRSASPARALTMLMLLSLPAAGCLSSQNGEDTMDVMLGSDTGTTTAGSNGGDSSTQPAIMTTTEEPDTTDTPDTASTSMTSTTAPPDTTTGAPASCGNGSLEAGEECDEGPGNADEGTCTTYCKSAACGDGFVQIGAGEVCDDKTNDGSYGGCASDCKSLGPHCGDGVVAEVEACDGGDPWDASSGCLSNCEQAQSCKQIRETFPDDDTLVDGVYPIKPALTKTVIPVYCDMDADGGGYTFLKIALPAMMTKSAVQAEAECDKYGMDLFVPRTQMHALAAVDVAMSTKLEPVGGGLLKDDIKYMSILGIYPVVAGKSCVDKPLNSEACDQWKAKNGPYWVTVTVVPGQPNTTNCDKCSMYYTWSEAGTIISYEAYLAGGTGATSAFFMCDTADKFGDF